MQHGRHEKTLGLLLYYYYLGALAGAGAAFIVYGSLPYVYEYIYGYMLLLGCVLLGLSSLFAVLAQS